jgi:hypothetical protein
LSRNVTALTVLKRDGDLEWLDALLNASMILGGMGPDLLHKPSAKLIASPRVHLQLFETCP